MLVAPEFTILINIIFFLSKKYSSVYIYIIMYSCILNFFFLNTNLIKIKYIESFFGKLPRNFISSLEEETFVLVM